MACKTHIQTHFVIISFFFLIENKDSDIKHWALANTQAFWKLYGGRTTPTLDGVSQYRGGLATVKPFQHNSWHLFIFNNPVLIHLTFILFLLLHLFTTNVCAFDLKQVGKIKMCSSTTTHPTLANLLQMKWEPLNSNTHFNMAQAS